MHKFERMTGLSLDELIRLSQGKGSSCEGSYARTCCGMDLMPLPEMMPIGAIMNEIGVIFVREGNPRAEDSLAELFDQGEPNIGSIAYFYLSQKMDSLKPETTAKVKKFEANPAHAHLVAKVKEQIARYA